jgi:hypothetical protein
MFPGPVEFRYRYLRLLGFLLGGRFGLHFALSPPDQRQRISRVERELTDRLLARRTQRHIDSAIAGKDDGAHILRDPLALTGCQFRVLLDRLLHLVCSQLLLLSEGFGFNAALWNSELHQKDLSTSHTPFRERLVVRIRSARIGVAFQDQVRLRLTLEIRLEVGSKSGQRSLLALDQSSSGFSGGRLRSREINAVQRKPRLEPANLGERLGRRRRSFNRD